MALLKTGRIALGRNIVSAAAFLLLAPVFAGCGGGGGGGGSTGGSGAGSTRVHLTVQWGGRSRSVTAPSSALSGVVVINGAAKDGGNFVWSFNRDSSRLESYQEPATSPVEAKNGHYDMTLTFYSQPDGGGVKVSQASKGVDIGSGGDLGQFSLVNSVASVQVTSGQAIPVGQSTALNFTCKDSSGNVVPVSAGSASITVVSGQDKVTAANGNVQGLQNGTAQVTVTVDGVTSAPETVAIGNVQLSVGATGLRSTVPIAVQLGGTTSYQMVDSNQTDSFPVDWSANGQVTVPTGYGDRQFVKWQLNGQDFSASPTLNFTAASLNGGTNLTAVYSQRAASASGFSPNYSQPTFPHWDHFPVRVYFVPNALSSSDRTEAVKRGINRWVQATGGFIGYTVVDDPNQADVTVTYGAMPNSDTYGFCQSTWDQDNLLVKADITLSQDLAQKTDGGKALESIGCHEFGHALGMTGSAPGAGHSTDMNDTMYPIGNLGVNVITERDMNTLTNIYLTELTRSQSATRAASGPRRIVGQATSACTGHDH